MTLPVWKSIPFLTINLTLASGRNIPGDVSTCFLYQHALLNLKTKTPAMIQLKRTDSNHPDFIALVKELDEDLARRDGNDHTFYSQFNKITMIKHAIVAYADGKPVACGAIKEFSPTSMEVKRMYTLPESRGRGIASAVLTALEAWAKESGYKKCILETGKKQPEAILLYTKSGYNIISNYGQYAGVTNSVCFEKILH